MSRASCHGPTRCIGVLRFVTGSVFRRLQKHVELSRNVGSLSFLDFGDAVNGNVFFASVVTAVQRLPSRQLDGSAVGEQCGERKRVLGGDWDRNELAAGAISRDDQEPQNAAVCMWGRPSESEKARQLPCDASGASVNHPTCT